MLYSKEDYIKCLEKIISPLKKYYTDGCAGIKCGNTGVHYGEDAALIEGFTRVLWGLAPLWGGGHDEKDFDEIYLKGIINGTDPESPEYWGKVEDYNQRIVESAALGLTLVLAPHKVWEPLTDVQKNNFHNWLLQINEAKAWDNNWKFFAVLVNLGLKNVGVSYSQELINHGIECFESYYKDNGWYTDGADGKADYYVAFAIHFYTLIYAKVMEKEDPETSRKYKERASLFAKDFIYWFDNEGRAIAFGRSLTYRFAQCAFWSACVFAGVESFSLGVIKGIISRHIEWWISQPIFDNGGVLSVGYAYPNMNMAENYNAFGSPYWALKSFLILALPDDHEFFKVQVEPLPKLDEVRVLPKAGMIIQHFGSYTVALTAGRVDAAHYVEKYAKFAYSSKYGFSVPRSYFNIELAAADSMLAFEIDGMIYVRRERNECGIEDGIVKSKWSPFKGITVETQLIPTKDGHIRCHKINSEIDCVAYDSAFATEEGSISGEGECITVKCASNTNLIDPYAKMKAVKYEVSKGVTYVETKVSYPL